ncbi:Rv2175c family DNA-binding protein [Pseudonocardia sp. GCM10023141]|uniref:Rv2175c family DNA-binding protein n=1 Tax=Pseudonocardia sp. GCM10023141 TaxID=3252653 RepID=UPI003613944C
MLPGTPAPVASYSPVNDVSLLSEDVAILPVAAVAEQFDIPVSRVHQLVRDGQLLSFRKDGEWVVPADFIDGDTVVKGLPGTITVMRDGGYTDHEILRWLFAEDDSLPGTPVGSLKEGRHREVKRRAQAMAF